MKNFSRGRIGDVDNKRSLADQTRSHADQTRSLADQTRSLVKTKRSFSTLFTFILWT